MMQKKKVLMKNHFYFEFFLHFEPQLCFQVLYAVKHLFDSKNIKDCPLRISSKPNSLKKYRIVKGQQRIIEEKHIMNHEYFFHLVLFMFIVAYDFKW